MCELKTKMIDITKISVPKGCDSKASADVLQQMADEIKSDGWPKGNDLGVKELGKDLYQVHASFSWFAAAKIAGIKTIPCNVY